MRAVRLAGFVLLAAAGPGCTQGSSRGAKPSAPVPNPGQGTAPQQDGGNSPAGGDSSARTVIVIDDGFDASAPVFGSKVVATYTIHCPDDDDDELDWDNLSEADLKSQIMSRIQSPSPCTLSDGATLAASPSFSEIAGDKTAWNNGILSKAGVNLSQDEITKVGTILGGENGAYDYHGTATAGTIAYQNPNVHLVLVELKLDNEQQAQNAVVCHHQAGVDKYVAVLQDPDVVQANTTAPLDPVDAQINDLVAKHGATLANLSLGGQARVVLESLYQQKGCGTVDLTKMFTAENALTEQRNAYLVSKNLQGPPILSVQAAGNDGAEIDSPADGGCHDLTYNTVLVGAFNASRQRSSFSNYGKCVDVYSLGEDVVVQAPEGFVNVESGTSFSTPLTVRFLTLNYPASMSVPDLQQALIAAGDSQHYLPTSAYPAALAFADKGDTLANYALVDAPRSAPPHPMTLSLPQRLDLKRRLPTFFNR